MGTKRCEHCGRALSRSASVCPGCGRTVPSPARRWTAALVALLFVLALLLALFQAFAGKGEAAVLRTSDGVEPKGQVLEAGGQVLETPTGVRGLRWWSAGEGEPRTWDLVRRAPGESHAREPHT